MTSSWLAKLPLAFGLASLLALGGCLSQRGPGDLASSEPVATVKTPKESGAGAKASASRRLRLRSEPGEAVASAAPAVPRPDQIFDFHPKGSSPDDWRQPFIVDVNDGPLRSYVRQTAAELKAFKADQARPNLASAAQPAQKAGSLPPCEPGKPETAGEARCAPPRAEGSAQLKQ